MIGQEEGASHYLAVVFQLGSDIVHFPYLAVGIDFWHFQNNMAIMTVGNDAETVEEP